MGPKTLCLLLFVAVCFSGAVGDVVNVNFAGLLDNAPAPTTPTTPSSGGVPAWFSWLIPTLNITSACFGQTQDQCNKQTGCYYYFGVCLDAGFVPPKKQTTQPQQRPETTVQPAISLSTSKAKEIGAVYEAYLSPQQEGGEEEDTPPGTPSQFKSTKPSVPRNLRPSRGHGVLQFTNDLSKAYAFLAVENINVSEINLLHIHCGRPGQLGPIIVDFSTIGNLTLALRDGILAFEVTNEDIVAVVDSGEGLLGLMTAGCPIIQNIPFDKVKTISGLELIARSGELYWNVHTYAQTYYGDMRGQMTKVK
jgi:hypothetical protein